MKERPILFSGPMIRAILAGTKVQTRRVAKPRREDGSICGPAAEPGHAIERWGGGAWHKSVHDECRPCPYGFAGDRLWCRETFAPNGVLPLEDREPGEFIYRADLENGVSKWGAQWSPSIFMPRRASRITLEITDVRVERLHDISHEDALAEGIDHYSPGVTAGERGESEADPRAEYQALWESINGAGSWARNEWVWVISFRRVEPMTREKAHAIKAAELDKLRNGFPQ